MADMKQGLLGRMLAGRANMKKGMVSAIDALKKRRAGKLRKRLSQRK